MGKLIALIIVVAGVVAGALLVFQQKQVRELRLQNEGLRSQLAAAEQQVESARVRVAPDKPNTGPDPELLRLRAEVARLRGVEAELARPRQKTNQAVAAPPAPASTPPATLADEPAPPYQKQVTAMTSGMKQIALALRVLGNDATATDKSIVQNGQVNPRLSQALSTGENAAAVDWSNVELLVTDAGDLNKVAPETIVARSKPIQAPDGTWVRVYASADGAAQQMVHQTADEVWDGSRPQQ